MRESSRTSRLVFNACAVALLMAMVTSISVKCGYVSKEDFASALRGHQAAVDATKSPQRELAEKRLSGRS